MVQQITFLKLPTFYKNDNAHGGAQAEAIKNCPVDSVGVGIIHPKFGRKWGYAKPEQLLRLLKKNNGVYEMISKYPYQVYFDIDKKVPPEEAGLLFLMSIKEWLSKYFPDAEYAVSGSVTQERTSFHITLNNYIIHNDEERHQLKMITKYLGENADSCFDDSVYSNNRLMKCINQSKADMRIQAILENDDPKKHMITCFINDTCLPFPTLESLPEAVKELAHIEKSKATFDLAMLPKLNLPCSNDVNFGTITAQQVLELLPNDRGCEFTYRHRVCRFCHTNGLEFNLLLAWICKKYGDKLTPALQKDKQKQWSSHWGNIEKYPPMSIDGMKPILKHFYPNICKDMHFRRFLETFNMKDEGVKKIETIAPEFFNQGEKCSVFNVGMGGGKTEQTISFLKDKESFCWIAPNKALASNTHRRFEQKDIDVCHYESIDKSHKQDGFLKEENKLIIVLNSLHYVTDKVYDVLVIDEIETLLDKFMGDFLEQKHHQLKTQIWKNFIYLFKSAKKIILLDAFITSKTLNFLKLLNIDYVVYERIDEPQTRTIKYMTSYMYMIEDIIDKLNNGKKVFIFYPFKKSSSCHDSMQSLKKTIAEKTGKHGQFYNADVDDVIKKELKNVNESWQKYDFVITNNIVTCGINYENTDFDNNYLLIAGHNSPRDIIQVSYRLRHLSSKIINVCYMGRMTQQNTWLNDCAKISCPVYNQLHNNILVEKKSPIKRSFQFFCKKAHYKQKADKMTVNEVVEQELKQLLEHGNVGMSYKNIKTIDYATMKNVQIKCIAQSATMDDKFQLNKYFFRKLFITPDDDKKEWMEDKLADIWDDKYDMFYNRLALVFSDNNNVFNEIAVFNGMDRLFPTDVKKVKLNDTLKEKIFKEFSFKYITKMSATCKIVKEIYNLYFGKFVINLNYDDNKNVKYETDKGVFEHYDFAKEHLVIGENNATLSNYEALSINGFKCAWGVQI